MTGQPSAADERLLATFLDLVRIDSPTGSEAACAAYCEQVLVDAGCSVRFDDSASLTGSDTGNLIAELPGTAPGVLVISAHLDCVEPCRGVVPVVEDRIVFSQGETILGADDKAGLAAAIECVRRLVGGDAPYPAVRCIFTVQEEVGLVGAKHLDCREAAGDLCLVLDAAGEPGGIVVGAPTHYTFAAEFTGRAAHAGVEPEAGISAVQMAGEAISRLPIGRLDQQTTANVGTVKGGTATNVMAARAEITGECRSLDRRRVEELKLEMDAIIRAAAAGYGGAVEIGWNLEYEGFMIDADSDAVELVAGACVEIGVEPVTFTTGGGSDANIIAASGTPTLALSCGMDGVHGTSEQIEVAHLELLTALCVAAAVRLGRRGSA